MQDPWGHYQITESSSLKFNFFFFSNHYKPNPTKNSLLPQRAEDEETRAPVEGWEEEE